MKRLLLFVFVVAWMVPAFSQHYRRVLIEEFTNASADCFGCAFQDSGFNATLQANYDIVTAIKYHVGWSNMGFDPLNAQNPSEVEARENYYAVVGILYGVINGTAIANDCSAAFEGSPACLSDTDLVTAYAQLTPVTLSINHSLSSNYDSIYVQISVTSDNTLTGPFRLFSAVTEEEILFDTPPSTNGEKEFFQVMRKMLPDAGGTATGGFVAGETKTYSFVW